MGYFRKLVGICFASLSAEQPKDEDTNLASPHEHRKQQEARGHGHANDNTGPDLWSRFLRIDDVPEIEKDILEQGAAGLGADRAWAELVNGADPVVLLEFVGVRGPGYAGSRHLHLDIDLRGLLSHGNESAAGVSESHAKGLRAAYANSDSVRLSARHANRALRDLLHCPTPAHYEVLLADLLASDPLLLVALQDCCVALVEGVAAPAASASASAASVHPLIVRHPLPDTPTRPLLPVTLHPILLRRPAQPPLGPQQPPPSGNTPPAAGPTATGRMLPGLHKIGLAGGRSNKGADADGHRAAASRAASGQCEVVAAVFLRYRLSSGLGAMHEQVHRCLAALSGLPSAVTLLSATGRQVLYQNSQSIRYMGLRQGGASVGPGAARRPMSFMIDVEAEGDCGAGEGGGVGRVAADPGFLRELFALSPQQLPEVLKELGARRPWKGIVRVPHLLTRHAGTAAAAGADDWLALYGSGGGATADEGGGDAVVLECRGTWEHLTLHPVPATRPPERTATASATATVTANPSSVFMHRSGTTGPYPTSSSGGPCLAPSHMSPLGRADTGTAAADQSVGGAFAAAAAAPEMDLGVSMLSLHSVRSIAAASAAAPVCAAEVSREPGQPGMPAVARLDVLRLQAQTARGPSVSGTAVVDAVHGSQADRDRDRGSSNQFLTTFEGGGFVPILESEPILESDGCATSPWITPQPRPASNGSPLGSLTFRQADGAGVTSPLAAESQAVDGSGGAPAGIGPTPRWRRLAILSNDGAHTLLGGSGPDMHVGLSRSCANNTVSDDKQAQVRMLKLNLNNSLPARRQGDAAGGGSSQSLDIHEGSFGFGSSLYGSASGAAAGGNFGSSSFVRGLNPAARQSIELRRTALGINKAARAARHDNPLSTSTWGIMTDAMGHRKSVKRHMSFGAAVLKVGQLQPQGPPDRPPSHALARMSPSVAVSTFGVGEPCPSLASNKPHPRSCRGMLARSVPGIGPPAGDLLTEVEALAGGGSHDGRSTAAATADMDDGLPSVLAPCAGEPAPSVPRSSSSVSTATVFVPMAPLGPTRRLASRLSTGAAGAGLAAQQGHEDATAVSTSSYYGGPAAAAPVISPPMSDRYMSFEARTESYLSRDFSCVDVHEEEAQVAARAQSSVHGSVTSPRGVEVQAAAVATRVLRQPAAETFSALRRPMGLRASGTETDSAGSGRRPSGEDSKHLVDEGMARLSEKSDDGSCWHEVAVTPLGEAGGAAAPMLLVMQTDVTERVRAERSIAEALEGEHQLLESIFPRHVLDLAASARKGAEKQGAAARYRLAQLPLGQDSASIATYHPMVTILFADVKGFTNLCHEIPATRVMEFLNNLYSRLDTLLDVYGAYKVETIGDCYMVAGGLMYRDADGFMTVRGPDSVDELHAAKAMAFAKAMLREASQVRLPTTGEPVEMRIGLHSGPVMSGIVGSKMPRFCLFGDTVNTASRMESTCSPGCIHVSAATCAYLPDEVWEPTGGVHVKGIGVMNTFQWRHDPMDDPLAAAKGGVGQAAAANNPAAASRTRARRASTVVLLNPAMAPYTVGYQTGSSSRAPSGGRAAVGAVGAGGGGEAGSSMGAASPTVGYRCDYESTGFGAAYGAGGVEFGRGNGSSGGVSGGGSVGGAPGPSLGTSMADARQQGIRGPTGPNGDAAAAGAVHPTTAAAAAAGVAGPVRSGRRQPPKRSTTFLTMTSRHGSDVSSLRRDMAAAAAAVAESAGTRVGAGKALSSSHSAVVAVENPAGEVAQ